LFVNATHSNAAPSFNPADFLTKNQAQQLLDLLNSSNYKGGDKIANDRIVVSEKRASDFE
jgi:hypothetical protein